MTQFFGYEAFVALRDDEGRVLLIDALELSDGQASGSYTGPTVSANSQKVLDAMNEAQVAYVWSRRLAPRPRSWKVVEPCE